MRDTYLKIDPAYYAARADLLRYLICYAEGGVYLDIKSTALRPLDEVIHPDDVFLLSQWRELRDLAPGEHSKYPMHPELAHVSGSEYVQWFLVCAAGHPFLRAVIEEVLARIDSYSVFMQGVGRMGVLRLTGPIAYTLAIHGIRDRVPHRYVDFEDDLSFVFSVWGDHKSHRKELGTTHYSQLALPIVRGDPLTAAAARAWFGGIQPRLRAARHRSRRLFARFSDRG
jgi:hypothetical protein